MKLYEKNISIIYFDDVSTFQFKDEFEKILNFIFDNNKTISNSNVYLKILEYLFLKYYKIVKVNGEKNIVELLDKNILFMIKVLCPIFTLRDIVVIYCIFSYYFNYKEFFDKLELKYKQEERYAMVYPDFDEAIAKNCRKERKGFPLLFY